MNDLNIGSGGKQILPDFRNVAKTYTEIFRSQRDHIRILLKDAHNLSSGIYRESLIRNFFTTILPQSVSVDSGFIYGFEQIENSKQIDILIWDSARHGAVYRTREFVIVPPEAVIAAISVKTTLDKSSLYESLDNLLSVTPLELEYGNNGYNELDPIIHPIMKIIVSLDGPVELDTTLKNIRDFFKKRFSDDQILAKTIDCVLKNSDPGKHKFNISQIARVFPKLIAVIDRSDCSFVQDWGPPNIINETVSDQLMPNILPYFYAQDKKLTTPFEKVVYFVLASTYRNLNTPGRSLVRAWGEYSPSRGLRSGDAYEILEDKGIPLWESDYLHGSVSN